MTALNEVQTAYDVIGALDMPQPEAPASAAIDAARAEVQRLFALERERAEQYLSLAAEIAQLETDAGASIVDGADPDELADRIEGAQRKLKLLDKTIAEYRRRRVDAIRAAWHAEAAEYRRRAAELVKEADARQVKTDELLKALEDWEGVPYIPDSRPQSEDGVIDRTIDHAKARRVPARYGSYGPLPEAQLWGTTITVVKVPQTVHLRNQAAALEQRARQVERRAVVVSGYISAASRDELLAELAGSGPMQLAPALHKVLPWLDAGEAADAKRFAGKDEWTITHMAPTCYVLDWKGGELDERASSVGPSRE